MLFIGVDVSFSYRRIFNLSEVLFAPGICVVQITVGSGGSGGVYGSVTEIPGGVDPHGKPVTDVIDQSG